jgi:hypothetical protein
MKSFNRTILVLALAGLTSYGGFITWRAHRNLVTLHVRNAPVEKVMSSLRWQTWEKFVWNKDIKGQVTLDVDRMPLESVLAIIGEQIQARWSAVYPIYLHKQSLDSLDQALRGNISYSESHFTNVQSRPFAMRGFAPGGEQPASGLVSLQLSNQDLTISALALQRFAPAQVFPENGWSPKINLTLAHESFDRAVSKVAKQARRSWTKLYALEPMRGFAPGVGGRGNPGEERGTRLTQTDPERQERNRERSEQLLDTLSPEDRQKAEARMEERREMQNLSPQDRQQVMEARMNTPEAQARAQERMSAGIKNTTPEQRRDRYERMSQMRKARAKS